ncbi:conserved hypothetical protein [Histoplasma mississippiense (nom. inval.)]|uniref:conserved hypothetical protein n=1 Tax=Ajellomyces capsulatus (strain NAm1 / WU24) TaxID=2059318 RepID=UPI000157CC0A|nr:conserved hypothetical protein [Histoplasma mississippiense (nom. inval.)]EDN09867.1 conserved hypothetical protein [Histoplasma mississippiense (nom. inval.)]
MDNHGSHLTEEFIQYCNLHKIILFRFPSHTSHILQPLDGVPFQQYKHYHTKAVNEAARYGYEQYGGRQFLANLESVRLQAFKPGTVRAGFADRGMYPVNHDIILNRLRPLTIDDAPDLNIYNGDGDVCNHFTPPPADRPSTASSQLTSPETVAKLRRQIDAAAKALQDVKDTLTPGLTRRLDKIFKGSMVQAELNAHREGELAGHYRANRRRVVKSSRRQVQVGGVLTIKDANCKIATRRADEMKKTFNKNLRSIGIKPTKSTATQPQQDNSIESQPTVDSTPSNESLYSKYFPYAVVFHQIRTDPAAFYLALRDVHKDQSSYPISVPLTQGSFWEVNRKKVHPHTLFVEVLDRGGFAEVSVDKDNWCVIAGLVGIPETQATTLSWHVKHLYYEWLWPLEVAMNGPVAADGSPADARSARGLRRALPSTTTLHRDKSGDQL